MSRCGAPKAVLRCRRLGAARSVLGLSLTATTAAAYVNGPPLIQMKEPRIEADHTHLFHRCGTPGLGTHITDGLNYQQTKEPRC